MRALMIIEVTYILTDGAEIGTLIPLKQSLCSFCRKMLVGNNNLISTSSLMEEVFLQSLKLLPLMSSSQVSEKFRI